MSINTVACFQKQKCGTKTNATLQLTQTKKPLEKVDKNKEKRRKAKEQGNLPQVSILFGSQKFL